MKENPQTNILTVIPQQDYGLIVEVTENGIRTLNRFDIPYDSISKIIDSELIVTLDRKNKKLLFHTIEGQPIKEMDVPFGITMNVKERVVYVGGDAKRGEVCYLLDLAEDSWQLVNIDLPVPMQWGKAVDDILIRGEKMLLIDNLVFPKYTFEYDISDPTMPKWVKTQELPHGRAYENIIKGDMNEDWMVYLSTSSGWSEDEAHITIEGKYDNTISSSKKSAILDICLIGDALYTMTDMGLGVFDLNTPELSFEDIRFLVHRCVADRIIKIDESRLVLVSKYCYEFIHLKKDPQYFSGDMETKFWSYGSLDLSDRRLERFPAEKIANIETLEHLDLSGNKLKKFPEALKNAKNLRSLNLSHSGIKKVPEWIESLEKLVYLNMSATDNRSLIPFMAPRMRFPKNLRILNLRYCRLKAIPPDLYNLEKLEYLNLYENDIGEIPEEIGRLKHLKTLKVRWENVSEISDAIAKLPIEEIEVSAVKGELPEVVFLLKNLKSLHAKHAHITRLSEKIAGLEKLEYLDIRDNHDLESLPENIGALKHLKTLGASGCKLKRLPQSFFAMKQLGVLHLQYNALASLPKEIGDLTKLRTLELSNNKLRTLPKEIGKLISLTKLSLNDNALEALPEELSYLKHIKSMRLQSNNFTEFPPVLLKMEHIRHLLIYANPFTEIPEEIGRLSNLRKLLLPDSINKPLPDSVTELTKLDYLSIPFGNIELSAAQQAWIDGLKANGCEIFGYGKA